MNDVMFWHNVTKTDKELRIIAIEKPDIERHWISNIFLDSTRFRIYRSKENNRLFLYHKCRDQWYEIGIR